MFYKKDRGGVNIELRLGIAVGGTAQPSELQLQLKTPACVVCFREHCLKRDYPEPLEGEILGLSNVAVARQSSIAVHSRLHK